MLDLGTLYAQFKVDTNEGITALKNVSSEVGNTENKSKSLGSTLKGIATGIGVTVALKKVADGLISCYQSASEFETGFAKVSTLLDESTTDFNAYKDSILDASTETGVAVGELSESVYQSISAGVDATDAVNFTTEAVKLAKGGFTDTASAVDVMTTAINGYKLSTDDATRISDLLITTQNLGKTTVDELAQSMGKVIPIASSTNFSIDELSATYATLTKNGIATVEAGTYTKAMLNELSKAGSTADEALHELSGKGFTELKAEGTSTTDILKMLSDKASESGMSLKDMFSSTEAGSAALVLMSQGGSEYNEILAQMGESAGATEDAFNKMAETPEQQMARLKNTFSNIGIELGEKLLPIVLKVATWVNDHLPQIKETIDNVFNKVSEAISFVTDNLNIIIPILAGAVAGFVAFNVISTILPLFTAVQTAITGTTTVQAALNAVMAANPIGAVCLAIGALIAIGVLLWRNWDTVKEKCQELFNKLSEIWENIKTTVSTKIEEMKTAINNKIEEFKTAAKNVFEAFKNGVIEKFVEIKTNVKTKIDEVKKTITDKVSDFKEAGKKIFTAVWDGIKGVWTDIKNWVDEKVQWLSDKLAFWKDSNDEMNADGSHRTGLDEVPFDGYKAILHKGEMVLTQPEADRYKSGNSSNNTPVNTTVETNVSVEFTGSLAELGRILHPVIKKEETRRGMALIGGAN